MFGEEGIIISCQCAYGITEINAHLQSEVNYDQDSIDL